MALQKIIVAYDFDEVSPQALDLAIEVAEKHGGRITLLHVVDLKVYGPDAAPFPVPDVTEQVIAASRTELGRVVASHAGISLDPVIVRGVAWQQIVAEAKARSADLVIMGSHSRRGLAHALLGSIAEKVLRMSPCAVLVVPAHRA